MAGIKHYPKYISIRASEELSEALDRYARKHNINKTDIVRIALEKELGK